MVVAVDPGAYYYSAKLLAGYADQVDKAVGTLTSALVDCTGMAGSYDTVKPWAGGYDERADTVIESTRDLSTAIRHFGYLVAYAGYNHDLANYHANISETKGPRPQPPPPETTVADACYVDSPPSMARQGCGVLD